MLIVNDEQDLAAIPVVARPPGSGGKGALTNGSGGRCPGGGAGGTWGGAFSSGGRQLPLRVFKLSLGQERGHESNQQ